MLLGSNLNSLMRTHLRQFCMGRRFVPIRTIHNSVKLNSESTAQAGGSGTHRPDIWDKRMLVWMKRYPNMESVPTSVSAATMEKVRSQVRIKLNIALCFMTAICSFLIYQYGKRTAIAKKAEEQN